MAHSNPHGLGVAWIDRNEGCVRWAKDVSIHHASALARRLPMPYLIHARLATVGSKAGKLCHPFEIAAEPSERLRGKAPKVLAHNGHVDDWQLLLDVAGMPVPVDGDPAWSDSRGLAAILSKADERILERLDGSRWVILDASGSGPSVRIWGAWRTNEQGRLWSGPLYGNLYAGTGLGFNWDTYENDDLGTGAARERWWKTSADKEWRGLRRRDADMLDEAGGRIDVADGAYAMDLDPDADMPPELWTETVEDETSIEEDALGDTLSHGPYCNGCGSVNHYTDRCPWDSVVKPGSDDTQAYVDKLRTDAELKRRHDRRARLARKAAALRESARTAGREQPRPLLGPGGPKGSV